jgi:murein DD-endopeptidase
MLPSGARTIARTLALLIATPMLAIASDVRESFDASVAYAPAAVMVDGAAELVYEIHLTNFSAADLALEALVVLDGDTGAELRAYRGAELARRIASVRGGDTNASAVLAPGRSALVFIEIAMATSVPTMLAHRIEYAESGHDSKLAAAGPHVTVDRRAPPSLGPPLRGGPWVAVYSPDWPRGHRRVVYAVDGRARIPGRFAIDWVKVDDAGHIAKGDADIPANALGYGADVLAVADARVAGVRDDMADSPSVAGNPKHAIDDAAGNYVALDLGDGRYAFYEHLEPGRVRVKTGDVVHRGQVIGSLGFTGDSTGPHLHFHVADGDSPLGAEGVPFAFDRYRLVGRYDDIGKLGSAHWNAPPAKTATTREHERPAPNDVVMF